MKEIPEICDVPFLSTNKIAETHLHEVISVSWLSLLLRPQEMQCMHWALGALPTVFRRSRSLPHKTFRHRCGVHAARLAL